MNTSLMWLLTQVTMPVSFKGTLTAFCFLSGIGLMITELLLPRNLAQKYRYIALMMGFSSFIIALQIWRNVSIIRFLPDSLIVVYWMILSGACLLWIRPMFLKRKNYQVHEDIQGRTLTKILPGETGRVLYEGVSWQAYCENCSEAIAAHQKVYILRREGNTLIVAPEHIFDFKNS